MMTRTASWLSRGLLVAGLFAFGIAPGGWGTAARAQSQASSTAFSYQQAPLRTVLHDLQHRTDYRVLYRDALVAGTTVTLTADSAEVLSALRTAVSGSGIRVEVDRTQEQVLLAPAPKDKDRNATQVVTGYVVDAEDGERLPRSTVTWRDAGGQRRGVVANQDGRVRLRLDPATLPSRVTLVASHVGYEPASVTLSPAHPPTELPFRLTPKSTRGPGVTVRTNAFPTALDTTWHGFTQPDLFSPLGEASVLRSLQTLPSVGVTSALSGGMHVRGSQADGFHVQIDGMPIYNQSHLFGLFDAFNDEALRTVGFFADVAPARYRAPPGGTLTLRTRTGGQTELGGTVELSSTAMSATADGPLWDGRGSWLLSARRSYLDAVDWFKNDDLIAQGVGSNVRRGSMPDRALPPGSNDGERDESSAIFYDVHGSFQYEWPSGLRLRANSYVGGDRTESQYPESIQGIEIGTNENGGDGTTLQPIALDTGTEWGNEAASIQLEAPLRPALFAHTTLSVSRYHAQFRRPTLRALSSPPRRPGERRPGGFRVTNTLVDGTLKQRLDGTLGAGTWTAGYTGRVLDMRYRTRGAGPIDFREHLRAVQGDLFGQYDVRAFDGRADVHLGLRLHGFSLGPHGRASPRVWIEGRPNRRLSITAGYTRNHQFLHRLSATGDTRVDTWTMSTDDRPPATSDQITLGIKAQPLPNWTLQLDGYYKDQRQVRLNRPVLSGESAAPRARPWATGRVSARGIEALHRLSGSGWQWMVSYAVSRADVRLPEVPGETWRPAPWDRRHQGTARIRIDMSERWSGHLTWLGASGAPNQLHGLAPEGRDWGLEEPARLDPYHRLDMAVQYRRHIGGVDVEARLSAFNVYNRDNPRYRQLVGVAEQGPPGAGRPVQFTGVDVYDLGFQPSFRIAASW